MSDAASVEIGKFFAKYPSRFIDKGEILVHGYSEQKSIHYLVSGRVKQYDIDSQGEEVVINMFGESDLFPIFWINNKNTKNYFFEATLPSELKSAPLDDVIDSIKNNNEISYELIGLLCSNFNEIQQRIIYSMKSNARNRTVFWILKVCKQFGKKLKNGSWLIDLREDELAKQIGLSRETVNREIAKLKQSRLVSITRKGFVVDDIKKLQMVFDEACL